MATLANIDISIIAVYIIICIIIGVVSARKQTPEQFLSHGRNIGFYKFVASTSASWIGGGAIVAYTAYVYQFGIAAVSLYIGVFISCIFFSFYAPRLRHEGHKEGHITLADFFYQHVGRRAGIVAAVVMGIAIFAFIMNQLIAGSVVLASISGWSYEAALFTAGIVVLIYLCLGGFKSVIRTDSFQYIMLIILVVIIGFFMVKKTGVDPQLLQLSNMSPALFIAFVVYGLFIPVVSADIWQRIYAAKNDKVVKWGMMGSGLCILIMGFAISLLGLAAKTQFPGIDPASAAAYGMVNLLPVGLLGLGLIVLFAAIMSSTDTLVFYLSSSIAKDYFARILKRESKEDVQKITRTFIVIVTVLSLTFAFFFRDIIQVILTVSGLQIAFFPPVIAIFHWKMKQNAIIAALVASTAYVLFLILTGLLSPELAMLSLVVSFIVMVLWQKFLP